MECLALLQYAEASGLSVIAEGENLKVRGPKRLAPLARRLLVRKSEIIRLLAEQANASSRPAAKPCSECGCSIFWGDERGRVYCGQCHARPLHSQKLIVVSEVDGCRWASYEAEQHQVERRRRSVPRGAAHATGSPLQCAGDGQGHARNGYQRSRDPPPHAAAVMIDPRSDCVKIGSLCNQRIALNDGKPSAISRIVAKSVAGKAQSVARPVAACTRKRNRCAGSPRARGEVEKVGQLPYTAKPPKDDS